MTSHVGVNLTEDKPARGLGVFNASRTGKKIDLSDLPVHKNPKERRGVLLRHLSYLRHFQELQVTGLHADWTSRFHLNLLLEAYHPLALQPFAEEVSGYDDENGWKYPE